MKGGEKALNRCALQSGLRGEDDRRISERHFDLYRPSCKGVQLKTVALPVFLFWFAVVVIGFLFICFVWANG